MRKESKPSWPASRKSLTAMEAFGICDVCEELPKDAKVITTRWENVPKGDKWRCRFAAREFRRDDPEMEGLFTSGSTATVDWWTCMRSNTHIQSRASMWRTRTSMLTKTMKFGTLVRSFLPPQIVAVFTEIFYRD